jgi:histone H2A
MSYEDVDFSTYIYRVLKQVDPSRGLSGDGLSSFNNFVRILLKKTMDGVNRLMLISGGKKTISSREVQSAVRLVFPGELAKHAVSQGTKAVTKYFASKEERESTKRKKGEKLKPVSRSKIAGLVFPITRVENIMTELSIVDRKSESCAVYMAAVLEYVIAEILEIAANVAADNKKVRITPRHIKLSILNDEELSSLFRGTLMSGGVALTMAPVRRKRSEGKEGSKKSTKEKGSKKGTSKSKGSPKKKVKGQKK